MQILEILRLEICFHNIIYNVKIFKCVGNKLWEMLLRKYLE